MTQLLVLGEKVLAVGPFTETESEVIAADSIWPKHVMVGWSIVNATLPAGFTQATHTWNGSALVSIAPDLGPAKLAKWEEIKEFRTARLNGGFLCGDHWYHSDPVMKTEFLGLKIKALETMLASGDMDANIQIDGTDTKIKTIDNGYMTVTGNGILAIVSAAEVQTKKIYECGATHQYYLNISATPESYNYKTGWPAVYGEA